MAITEETLWMLRFALLGLMALFLIALVIALFVDARAAGRRAAAPATEPAAPAPAPTSASPPPPAAPVRPPAQGGVPTMVSVVAGTEPTTGRRYGLTAPLVIGRADGCDIAIPVRFVSSRHARLYPGPGGWVIEDLGSRNGTFVNGVTVSGATTVRPGDRILVGDTEFAVV